MMFSGILIRSRGLLAAAALFIPCLGPAQTSRTMPEDTDFGQVGMWMATMLQKHHYSREVLDDELSANLLKNYLEFLDYNRVYFLQEDVAKFQQKYASRLDDVLLGEQKIEPAIEIYDAYLDRVRSRVAWIKEALAKGDFSFDSGRTILIDRKEAPWPADSAAADQLWHDLLEGDLLKETLLAENSAENDASDPAAGQEDVIEAPEIENDADTQDSPTETITKRFDRFLEELEKNEVEDISNFFLSALCAAYDPHSEYFSQSELDNFQTGISNRLVGIGALLQLKDGMAEIQGIVVGGPADKSGLLGVNDRIIGVAQGDDGEFVDVKFMKLQKIVEMIRGDVGTVVRLRIVPADAPDASQSSVISIIRDEVKLKDKLATAQLIRNRDEAGNDVSIGWIDLPSFYADLETGKTSTTRDVSQLLERLLNEGISGLVLDLRGNGGGSLEEAIKLTGLFIPAGPIVQSKDYQQRIDQRSSRNRNPVYDGPMIVLTDRVSASASEILAAALQDYNRALVVGEESTFGKGTVQTILPVAKFMPFFSKKERAGALKVTIQKFYRIAGGSTQLRGVIPDLTLPSLRDVLEIGEDALDNPLPYDEIPPQRYRVFSEIPLPIKKLRELSASRVAANPDFQYVLEDANRLTEQMDKNTVSLNLDVRRAENAENRQRRKDRNTERRERYTRIEAEEEGLFDVYKLTLDNVGNETLTLESEFTDEDNSGMRMAKGANEAAEADKPPEFPHGLETVQRETLAILADLIREGRSTAETARVVPATEN